MIIWWTNFCLNIFLYVKNFAHWASLAATLKGGTLWVSALEQSVVSRTLTMTLSTRVDCRFVDTCWLSCVAGMNDLIAKNSEISLRGLNSKLHCCIYVTDVMPRDTRQPSMARRKICRTWQCMVESWIGSLKQNTLKAGLERNTLIAGLERNTRYLLTLKVIFTFYLWTFS